MGDKISALPAASTPLAGTELVPIVQSGGTVSVSAADLANAADGTRSIATGGTNATSQTSDGLAYFDGTSIVTGPLLKYSGGGLRSASPSGGLGYGTGAGATVTQTTNRTTGVTINAVTGSITLVSAAGSATFATFTVSNSAVAATDVIVINQRSGTDLYRIHVTAVGAGSFNVTFATTAGTTTEQPVFSFAVIKGVTA